MENFALDNKVDPELAFTAPIKKYLSFLLIEKGLSKNTIYAYDNDLKFLALYLDKMHISSPSKVDELTILAYINSLYKHKLCQKSVARHIASFKGFFSFLCDRESLSVNPTILIETPKLDKNLPLFMSQNEIKDIFASIPLEGKLAVRDRNIIELLYASGLRVSELINIALVDYDPHVGLLRVFGKGAKERLVPLHIFACGQLNTYISTSRELFKPKSDFLFLNRSGTALSRQAIWKLVKKYAILANIQKNIYPHTFRHSFATHLLEGGADLRTLQILLGHADITATEIYTHVQSGKLQELHRKYHPRTTY